MTSGAKTSRWRFLPAVIWAAAIWAESSTTWPAMPHEATWLPQWLPADKVAHGLLFGVQALLIAAPIRQRNLRVVTLAWVLAVVWGAADEVHQLWVPGRTSDPWDWFADGLGAAIALAMLQFLARWQRKPGSASRPL